MLLWLAQLFQDQIGALRVFNFITFRAVFATLTALLIGLIGGGYGAGNLSDFIIESDGTVKARYTNGQSKALARVQLADFKNLNGLQPVGDNEWKSTNASGQPLPLGAPGSGVYGLLQSGALEESNIDMTQQLVAMIEAQRAYQASAQTIKTQDQVQSTVVNLR